MPKYIEIYSAITLQWVVQMTRFFDSMPKFMIILFSRKITKVFDPPPPPQMGQGPRKWTQINQGQLGANYLKKKTKTHETKHVTTKTRVWTV